MPASQLDLEEAQRIQVELRERLELSMTEPVLPKAVAGLDVSYAVDSSYAVAAAVVLDLATLEVVDQATAAGTVYFPYIPGLLAFREVPLLLEALGKLKVAPDLLVCDGYGIAHPRRFGLACHVGVLTGIPSFGVAKTPFTTNHTDPGQARGDWSELREGDELLGRVLRTRYQIKPVFVSIGHRIGLDEATRLTLTLTPKYRLPQTTRLADQLSRRELARR